MNKEISMAELGIENIELCYLAGEGLAGKAPVLFIHQSRSRKTGSLAKDFYTFLQEQFPDVEISGLTGESYSHPSSAPKPGSLVDRLLQRVGIIETIPLRATFYNFPRNRQVEISPEVLKLEVFRNDDPKGEDAHIKIWFLEGWKKYQGEYVNPEELAKNYMARLQGPN